MEVLSCLVCKGKHFRKGDYELEINVDVNSTAYNKVNIDAWSHDDVHIDIDGKVDTSIHNDVTEKGDISLRLIAEDKSKIISLDEFVDVFKYVCEECGFIMNFTQEKNYESKFQEKKRKQRENAYDWSGFEQ